MRLFAGAVKHSLFFLTGQGVPLLFFSVRHNNFLHVFVFRGFWRCLTVLRTPVNNVHYLTLPPRYNFSAWVRPWLLHRMNKLLGISVHLFTLFQPS